MVSFIPKKNTPDRDIVMTPENVAQDIIKHFSPKGKILDPCRGRGAFFNNFPKTEDNRFCEISEGLDFLQYEEPVDWIITNPPWSDFKRFLVHGMEIANNVCYLIPFNHYSTKLRLRLIQNHGFGICEFYGVNTPKTPDWPQSGFQLGVTHIKKGYIGPIMVSGTFGAK